MSQTDNVCLNTTQMLLSTNKVGQIINAHVMPFIIVFGVSGNIINLTVLLTPSLRSRSNKLLAALAIADIIFLLMLIPHVLAAYPLIALNYTFRQFYYYTQFKSIALNNWVSAIAIWLILIICFERLIGVRYPLSSRKGKFCNTNFLILGIVIVTGILTAYYHFSQDCMSKIFCHGTQFNFHCIHADSNRWFSKKPNPHSEVMRAYVRYSPYLNAIAIVLLPTVFIVLLNVLLVRTLSERKAFLQVSTSVKCDADGKPQSTNQMNSQLRTEQRITMTVCLIVTSFILTQTPSAIYVVYQTAFANIPTNLNNTLQGILNLLVAIGKSINFILFCLSSPSFRQRLLSLTKDRFNRSINKKSAISRKLSVDTEMTIYHQCGCNENHALLREPCRCSSRASPNDMFKKSPCKSHTNTTDQKAL